MSMRDAKTAFVNSLGANPGVSLLRGVAQYSGSNLVLTFTVMNPDGTTTDITQTIAATDDHIGTAASMASGYVTQLQQAGKLATTATPTVDTMTVQT